MSAFDANRDRMGLHGPPVVWSRIDDFNPDHHRSFSSMFIVDRGDDIVWTLQVKGIGVIVMRALDSHTFAGMSIFSKAEIGYSPDL